MANLLLADDSPVAFGGDLTLWTGFRTSLAGKLGVKGDDIHIVGSGSCGFSLSPFKWGSTYQPGSDLDVVVVSESEFDFAWNALRRHLRTRTVGVEPREMVWRSDRFEQLFFGYMYPHKFRVDQFEGSWATKRVILKFRAKWFDAVKSTPGEFPGTFLAGKDVRVRLYRSIVHAQEYHAESFRRLQYRVRHPIELEGETK